VTRGFSMPPCSHITDTIATPQVRETGVYEDFGWPYYADVADRPPHYLREWRKHRKLTQQELADAINTSKSAISDLERFNLQLSPKWLNRIAPVLDTQPGYILDHDPENVPADVIDIWSKIPERDRERAARVLREFTRTGTDD
jgi:transcriptional regulator with XRE-family HTH domain